MLAANDQTNCKMERRGGEERITSLVESAVQESTKTFMHFSLRDFGAKAFKNAAAAFVEIGSMVRVNDTNNKLFLYVQQVIVYY